MNPIMSNVEEQSMSTPNPRHCKLEGLALYAPRRARTQTATAEARWRAKLDRIAAAIASVEAIEAERGTRSSTLGTVATVEAEHDVGSSASDMVEAIEAEHDVRSDVGSSPPGTVEAVEAEHGVGSWTPDVPELIFLVTALHTPGLPSSSDQAADWPGFSIEEGPIDSGAAAHGRLQHAHVISGGASPLRPDFARRRHGGYGNLCSHHRADLSVGRSFAQKRQQQSCRRTGAWSRERWYRRCRPRAATGSDELNHSR
jgi:hypothetical protein